MQRTSSLWDRSIKDGGNVKLALRVSISVLLAISYFVIIASAQVSESRTEGSYLLNEQMSNQSYNIRVVLDHIFISNKNNSLEISEIVVFRNEGTEIYYSKDNHTFFAISIPHDVENLKTEAMECCLVREEGMVFMDPMQPIAQGANFEMKVSYTLIPQGKEYVFNKTALYNTTSLSIFVDKRGGLGVDGAHETLTLNGNEYNVLAFDGVKARETVRVPVKMNENSSYLYAGIGFVFLFSIGFVYLFKEKLFRKREEEYTLEELELEKRKVFKTIYGFEKHAGTESTREYKKLMEEYRQKAIQIFIKMDKIKNRDGELYKNNT